jgi:hypothetical protein
MALAGHGVKGTAKPRGTTDIGLRVPSTYVVKGEACDKNGTQEGGVPLTSEVVVVGQTHPLCWKELKRRIHPVKSVEWQVSLWK